METTEKAFDAAAQNYDQDFTQSAIGKLQRKRVLDYLDRQFNFQQSSLDILELNCGTGYDALYFLERGNNVLATDLSEEMLNSTKSRCRKYLETGKLKVERLDINKINGFQPQSSFDLVFSNFAGLNCLDSASLQKATKRIAKLLKPNGRFISILLSRSCIWEQLYFGLKGDSKKALRRKSKEAVSAHVSGIYVDTYYYNPEEFFELGHQQFEKVGLFGIGITVPPSYLEPAFQKRPGALSFLNKLEELVGHFSLLADRADHYLIDLKKTN